jgi:DNA invertase Pin-like site-specific DNA recombinase
MKLAYCQIGESDRNPDRLLAQFRERGVEERFIFVDKASDSDTERPCYQTMRRMIRQGDLVYVDRLERLGRNYDEIIAEWKYISRELNADIICLENEALFDSRRFKMTWDVGKLLEIQFLGLLAHIAEMERTRNRQHKADAGEFGQAEPPRFRPPRNVLDDSFIRIYTEWKRGKITAKEAMKQLGLKKSTFYRHAKKYEQLHAVPSGSASS